MALAAFSGVVLPEAKSALASLRTRPVSGPNSWSMAIWIHCDLSISWAICLEERIFDRVGGAFDRRDK